jgi:hypothetical protein
MLTQSLIFTETFILGGVVTALLLLLREVRNPR